MKYLALMLALSASSVFANDVYVKPHVNRDGTYVEGHYRTAPNNNPYDNYSTQGNVNPYTGQTGTVTPYPAPQPVYSYPMPTPQNGYCNPAYPATCVR